MANSIEILNPPKMYRIRPFFEIKKVKLPDCMYLLKPLHQLTNIAASKSGEETSSALSYLEKRQEWVLSQINRLQGKVKVLAENMGVGPDEVGILQQEGYPRASSVRDVVVSCPPNAPPYALRALYHFISGCVPTACKVHIHSSASSSSSSSSSSKAPPTQEDLRNFWGSLPSDPRPVLRLVLIWKSGAICKAPTMVVSPQAQTPVEGMANICRYLCREYFPALYEEVGSGNSSSAELASAMDSWMDSLSSVLSRGTGKEKASVLRRLNAQLGSSQFLVVGEQPTVADIVGFCEVCGQSDLKLPSNVKLWMKRVQCSVPSLRTVPCPYLTQESS